MKVPKSKEEITVSWLNSAFSLKDFKVLSFKWKGPANNGLGAMSSLERLQLQLVSENGEIQQSKSINVILKFLPTEPQIRKYMVEAGFARRELKMYTDLFTDWDRFCDTRKVSDHFRFRRPICYYGASEGEGDNFRQLLILEDLIESGFHMLQNGFDSRLTWNEAQPFVKQIAQFHALGLAYKQVTGIKSYRIERPYLDHYVAESEAGLMHWIKTGFKEIFKLLTEYHEDGSVNIPEGMMDHMQVLRDNAFYNLRFMDPLENEIATVCHHDLHINNFMLKDGDSVVFDFQASCYSYVTKDLSYFLIQTCENVFEKENLNEVIKFYHDELHKTLSEMGITINYDFESIMQEYRRCAYLSALHIIAGAAHMYGAQTADESKRSFIKYLADLYKEGMLECRIKPTSV